MNVWLTNLVFWILFFSNSLNLNAAVIVIDKMWSSNTELVVVFLDGDPVLIDKVKNISQQWLKKTNLSFKFYLSLNTAPNKTHIRVSFKSHTGSKLGNQKDLLSKEATLNLFDLTSSKISDSGAQRLILHEFGHALGLEHEFRSPYWPYNQAANAKIIKKCAPKMKFLGYSDKKAISKCSEISSKLKESSVHSTAYDEISIMNYAIVFTDTKGRFKSIPAQTELSYLDQYALQKWYPKRSND